MPSDEKSGPRRRTHPRIPVSVSVVGQWWTPAGEGPRPFKALLVRLSEGGAMLRCGEPMTAKAKLELTLRLGLFLRFKPRGVVLWWRRSGEVREIGVQFERPVPQIGRWVERQLEEQAESSRPAAKGRRGTPPYGTPGG